MPILGSTGVFRSASKSQTAVIPTEQAISLPPPGSVIKMKLLGKNGTESLKLLLKLVCFQALDFNPCALS
jgi:hypothetical protein